MIKFPLAALAFAAVAFSSIMISGQGINSLDFSSGMGTGSNGTIKGDEASLTDDRRMTDFSQLSRVVDTLYEVGPGDIFNILIVGSFDKGLQIPVTADGRLIIPSYGDLMVTGLTLANARLLVSEKLSKIYKNTTISVALIKLRTFRVFVTGDLPNPGSRNVTGTMRVSDLLDRFAGSGAWRYRRSIRIVRDGTLVGVADLASFYNRGEFSGNQLLKENMVIDLPKRDGAITISGAISYEGRYDFSVGDSLGSIIGAAGGCTDAADSSRMLLARFRNTSSEIDTVMLSYPRDGGKHLQSGDRIVVSSKPAFHKAINVIIIGEVKYPGVYPIRKDQTTASDLVDLAGGVTEDAFLSGAYIIRPRDSLLTKDFAKDPSSFLSVIKSLPLDPTSIRPEEMTYMRSALTENGERILFDAETALKDRHGKNDVMLKDKDLIVVTRKNVNIQILGAVSSPGLVGYENGRNAECYVKMAGGFGKNAEKRNVLIRRSGTTSWVSASSSIVNPGDAILVPEARYRDTFLFTKDMFNLVASAVGIVASLVTILVLAKGI